MRAMNSLGFPMSIAVAEHGIGPVFFLYPLNLIGDNGGGFIPGNPLIFALAPVLRISLAVGVPVHPLQGI